MTFTIPGPDKCPNCGKHGCGGQCRFIKRAARPRPLSDELLQELYGLLRQAHGARLPLSIVLADELAHNKQSHRRYAERIVDLRTRKREKMASFYEKSLTRLTTSRRNLLALRRRYASLQSPVYWHPSGSALTTR